MKLIRVKCKDNNLGDIEIQFLPGNSNVKIPKGIKIFKTLNGRFRVESSKYEIPDNLAFWPSQEAALKSAKIIIEG